MADETFWIHQFEKKANWPLTWSLTAEDLLVAADLLFDAFRRVQLKTVPVGRPIPKQERVLSAVLLLRAAALEALLKGRAVRRGHRFVEGEKFTPIPDTGNGHDLVLLACATAFSLNAEERDFLLRLSPHLELARYPVGKSWRAGLKKDPHRGVGHVVGAYYSSQDERILARLLKRLRCAVH